MPDVPDEAWESEDRVRRMVVMPAELAEQLAARAEQRGLSVSDLLVEYAEQGLDRDAPGLSLPSARVEKAGRPHDAGRPG